MNVTTMTSTQSTQQSMLLKAGGGLPEGKILTLEGELWFEVENAHRIPAFLMTMISDRDHWLFINSDGSMTMGRKNPDHALLPYYTQDKLQDMSASTGGVSVIRVEDEKGKTTVWKPFQGKLSKSGNLSRNVRKNVLGNAIEFEEKENELGLKFIVTWRPSGKYGFVRKVRLENQSKKIYKIEALDGLQNLMCPGLEARFQNEFSNLGDAYKQGEILEDLGYGMYCLSSQPTDLAQPKEALRANVVWNLDGGNVTYQVVSRNIDEFSESGVFESIPVSRGERLAFITMRKIHLQAQERETWYTIAEVGLDRVRSEALVHALKSGNLTSEEVERDCRRTEENLREMLASADAQLLSKNKRGEMRHISNTVFNLMRGGALPTGYAFPKGDLVRTASGFNHQAGEKLRLFEVENGPLDVNSVWSATPELLGKDALRLAREYLPLTFSRRHGDPSRPWNKFSIDVEEADGSPRYAYQGNWRDIFQNWEALLQSYPEYTFSAIGRFLNASSADGYNPYRLTKDGFEWEEVSPDDPWANIGYWGDHQIIYLLKLLETAAAYYPDKFARMLTEDNYVYAEIPYRICNYEEMITNPRDTVTYDNTRAELISTRVKEMGADGKLLQTNGKIHYVTFLEKLLVPMLAKLSNFIPGGGIWMNTQRPEWNDANNALVGFGISVVTAGYLYRYLDFLESELAEILKKQDYTFTAEVADWLEDQVSFFLSCEENPSESGRKDIMDLLGTSASAYRNVLYTQGLKEKKRQVSGSKILELIRAGKKQLQATLLENKREDGLFHSYNLLDFKENGVAVKYLYPMLEGQVSILSSGLLDSGDTLNLLRALRLSPLYREDQKSYLLYPDRELPGFRAKNKVSSEALKNCGVWYERVLAGKTKLLRALEDGSFAFHPDLVNASLLKEQLKENSDEIPEAEVSSLVELYETVFNHKAFTGRSGTFFAYEGLGSIYWHMVSKLALAVQECMERVCEDNENATFEELETIYQEIKEGLGVNKPVWQHGAIPTDAYSHTPKHLGAQQPGMTGQVKEDILSRLKELGVSVNNGEIRFCDKMLRWEEEGVEADEILVFITLAGKQKEILVPRGSILFSFCQIPIIYSKSVGIDTSISVQSSEGASVSIKGNALSRKLSSSIFKRDGLIEGLNITFGK